MSATAATATVCAILTGKRRGSGASVLTLCPREMCTRKNPCAFNRETGRHPTCAQRFNPKCFVGTKHTLNELYSMPEQLTDDIALAVDRLVDSYSRIVSVPPFCGRSGGLLEHHFPDEV